MEWPWRLLALPFTLDLLISRVPPAAVPPVPTVDDVVPIGLVDVPPVPSVDAEVPPAAPLPAVPPVAADPLAPTDAPPLPTDDALCASASGAAAILSAPARSAVLKSVRIE